jgi:hypothetical protein
MTNATTARVTHEKSPIVSEPNLTTLKKLPNSSPKSQKKNYLPFSPKSEEIKQIQQIFLKSY